MEDGGGDGGFNIKSHNKKDSTKHILSKNGKTLAKEGTEEHTKCKEGRKKSYSSYRFSFFIKVNQEATHTHTHRMKFFNSFFFEDIQTKQQNQKEVKRNPTENFSKTPVDGEKEITYSSDRWKIEFKLQKYANSSFLPFFILFYSHGGKNPHPEK